MSAINHPYQTALLDGLLGSAAICHTGMETVRLSIDGLVSFQWFAVFPGGWFAGGQPASHS